MAKLQKLKESGKVSRVRCERLDCGKVIHSGLVSCSTCGQTLCADCGDAGCCDARPAIDRERDAYLPAGTP